MCFVCFCFCVCVGGSGCGVGWGFWVGGFVWGCVWGGGGVVGRGVYNEERKVITLLRERHNSIVKLRKEVMFL